jgi:hypothetical protein
VSSEPKPTDETALAAALRKAGATPRADQPPAEPSPEAFSGNLDAANLGHGVLG